MHAVKIFRCLTIIFAIQRESRTVLEAMESVDLMIRRFAMRSKRWMFAYMEGLTVEQRAYAEKSHRRETVVFGITYCHSDFLFW